MRGLLMILVVAGCSEHGSGGGGDAGGDVLVGECEPPAGSVEVKADSDRVGVGCFDARSFDSEVDVVESAAQWEQLFGNSSCMVKPPPHIDFARARVGLVHLRCSPIDVRFVAETASELVIGVMVGTSGACITPTVGVALPRSEKPVRVARCRVQCDDCPPVP
ncbi:MAG: hypothetical protein KIT31_08690 [Deltaproteobacteria bacterium]|nr:hypothetical protein [Deltaproteobacteria bacterium]